MKLVALYVDQLVRGAKELLEKLQLPARDEYISALQLAFSDISAASKSTWNVTYLTFRPIFILLGILGGYLAVLLRYIAKHSVEKGWIAAKEGYFQLRTATIWFVNYQRNLSSTAKYAELGVLSALALLWMLRRHVKKYRYVERTANWYNGRKRRAIRKYHRIVERVAKTSSFLAALLPHIFYVIFMVGMKRAVPWLFTYLATRTYLTDTISFWHPLYLTISTIAKLTPHILAYNEEQGLKETGKDAKSKALTPSARKKKERDQIEMETLRREAVDLLKYWTVYALMLAITRSAKQMPIVGRILNATNVDPTKPRKRFSLPRVSTEFVQEVSLLYYMWLRLMPTSITGDEVAKNVEVALSITKPKDGKTTSAADKLKRPVDILFTKLFPLALMTMNSTAFLSKHVGNGEAGTFFTGLVRKLTSLLDLLVWSRVMSESFKEWLITTIIESSALGPAVTTLLMPSYFTSFGVIYVSLVVPAGYSAYSAKVAVQPTSKLEVLFPQMDDANRYLKFWVVHAVVSMLLSGLDPFLAWVPLSTHATWLLWAYVQLKSTTLRIYAFFESELGHSRIEDTVIARGTRRILGALPSNTGESAEQGDEAGVNGSSESAKQGDEAGVNGSSDETTKSKVE